MPRTRGDVEQPVVVDGGEDRLGGPEPRGEVEPLGADVDGDDRRRPDDARGLDHVEADAAAAEHDDERSRRNLRRVEHRADAGHHAAPGDRPGGEVDVVGQRRHRPVGDEGQRRHRAQPERAAELAVADRRRARVGARSGTTLERRADLAQMLVALDALKAAPARHRPVEQHAIADGDVLDTLADGLDDAGALVAEDHVGDPPQVVVGMAQPRGVELDTDFAVTRRGDLDGLDGEPAVGSGDHGAARPPPRRHRPTTLVWNRFHTQRTGVHRWGRTPAPGWSSRRRSARRSNATAT
jgi:hypothetical protein